jgi:hypothetical protein
MKHLEVRSTVVGEPRVRIINATNNVKGYENEMTEMLVTRLGWAEVPVERTSSPTTPSEFFAALGTGGEYNVLILIAHGGAKDGPKDPKAIEVDLSGLAAPWLLLTGATAELGDKLVMLATCDGHCEDTVSTFVTDHHLALFLLASTRKVQPDEVYNVFPAILKTLKKEAKDTGSFCGETVERARRGNDSKNAYRVTSGVGLLP